MRVADDRLPISETFVSLQGEGMLTGVPSWFVRTSGCNLRCAWCDTPYASWAPEGGRRSVESLVAEAREIRSRTGIRHLVLTGGEPMLFSGSQLLCEQMMSEGWHATIETAGTIASPGDVNAQGVSLRVDLMSISPKLSNSTPVAGFTGATHARLRVVEGGDASRVAARHEAERLRPEVLRSLVHAHAGGGRAYQLKFVVSPGGRAGSSVEDELSEIGSLLDGIGDVDPGAVILMPEGVATPAAEDVGWIVQTCLSRGWRYGHRLHVQLFGDQRGT